MAGDLQFTNTNTGEKWKGKTKLYKFDNPDIHREPFIVGFAGSANDIITITHYWTLPEAFSKPPKITRCSGLVLSQSGKIYYFDDYTRWLFMDVAYSALGSGCNYALGALAAEKSPKEAVKIAMKHDSYTGLGVKVMSFS